MTSAKKSKIEWLKLNGRNMAIDKTEETKHFETGSVLQSKNGNQFKLIEHDDIYEVVPMSANVNSENVYLMVGSLSPEFSQQIASLKGSEKLGLCRSIGVV